LPQYFKHHGYETVYLGKVFHPGQTDDEISWSRRLHLPGSSTDNSGVGEPQTHEYKLPASLAVVKQRTEAALAKYGPRANLQGMSCGPAWEAADLPDNAYLDGRIADGAIAELRELKAAGRPFFFGVGFHKPHLPFVAPKKYFDLYDPATLPLTAAPNPPAGAPAIAVHHSYELRTRTGLPADDTFSPATSREILRAYDACVSFSDAQIGRVLAELDALGLRENTIIVLWGDNGWHLGEQGMWGKATDYDVATRVPLIVSVPGLSATGRTAPGIVELVDVYPTLCELAGLPVPPQLAGRSFVPLLRDPGHAGKEAAFSQFPSPALREWAARPFSPAMGDLFAPAIHDVETRLQREQGPRYDLDLFTNHLMGYTVRTDRYRYTVWVDRRAPTAEPFASELYDHASDPNETVNVVRQPRYSDQVRTLANLIQQSIHQTSAEDPAPVAAQ